MSVVGTLRIQECINVGYETDAVGSQASIFFNGLASDNTTPLSTELKMITTVGAEQGYLELGSGLLVNGVDVIEQINLVTSKIFDPVDNETKIETKQDEIVVNIGLTSAVQGVTTVADPIIEIKENTGRIETTFSTDFVIAPGNNFTLNGPLVLNSGLTVNAGGIGISSGDLNVTDNTIINGTLQVDMTTSLNDALDVDNGITINSGGLISNGISIFNDNTEFKSDLTIAATGELINNAVTTFNNSVNQTAGSFTTTNSVPATIDGLLTASNGLIVTSGDVDIQTGNLTVQGNLTINGSTSTISTTNLDITDNTILLNKDETGMGVTLNKAGIEIERGTLDNIFILFDENDMNLKFGTNLNLQDVALRDTDLNMSDGAIPVWDSLNKRFETVGGLTEAEATQLGNIGAVTISNQQWGYLGNMNQDVTTSSDVNFDDLTLTGNLNLGALSNIIKTPLSYDLGNNNQTNINTTFNLEYGTIFMKNLNATLITKTAFLTAPSTNGIIRNFVFAEKSATATSTDNYIQIIIPAADFVPPYDQTGTPTQYTVEFRNIGQSLNLISDGSKWFLLNACNCVLTDNG